MAVVVQLTTNDEHILITGESRQASIQVVGICPRIDDVLDSVGCFESTKEQARSSKDAQRHDA